MKYLFAPLALLTILGLFAFAPSTSPAPAAAPSETSVTDNPPLAVLELFTSQGCSSCPPADALLREMNERAAAGDNIIALSYHVDYWNYLGWEDPFSSPHYSARQTDYTERIGARTYTPQLVINGRAELVGSRRAQVTGLVDRALNGTAPTHAPALTATFSGRQVKLAYTLAGPVAGHRVTAVLAQQHAASAIKRGENRGRDLTHHNVVRALAHAAAAASGEFTLELPDELSPREVTLVLLVQNEQTHQITGAARQ